MSETRTLSISERHGSIRFLHKGTTVFEGAERDGQLVVSFKRNCGVRADFQMKGTRTVDSFELSGSGTVFVGELSLENATVKASSSGVVVDVPTGSADRIKKLRFMLGATPGSWCGVMELNEPLQCLVVEPPTLRASLAFELSHGGIPVRSLATAELDEARVEIALTDELQEHFRRGLPEIRRLLLRAVAEKLTEELDWNEHQFYASPDELVFTEESLQASLEYNFQPPVEPGQSRARPGYPPIEVAPRFASRAQRPGYPPIEVAPRFASRAQRPGYPPIEVAPRFASRAQRPGYPPIEVAPRFASRAQRPGYPPIEVAPRFASRAQRPGYPPIEVAPRFASRTQRPGYPPIEVAPRLAAKRRPGYPPIEVSDRSHFGRPARSYSSAHDTDGLYRQAGLYDYRNQTDLGPRDPERSLLFADEIPDSAPETIAYRILWCKDLLRAIGNATSLEC
jgi:hypothetical protein